MSAKVKTKTEVNAVTVISRHSFKFDRFEELVRFNKGDSIFKKWEGTMRLQKNKPFATGFIKYKYD